VKQHSTTADDLPTTASIERQIRSATGSC